MPRAGRRHGAVLILVTLLLLGVVVGADATKSAPECFGRAPTIIGTEGSDTLSGTAASDVIAGLGGNDTINGRGRIDFICGGGGDDSISGGRGNDSISGDAGNDLIRGSVGNDRILGSAGDDILKGQDGDDTLTGGLGTDRTVGGPGTDTCATSETRTSCEVVPPSGCTAASRVPAIPVATNVTVVGSNAYHTHSSFGICTGGVCDYDYLDFAVELRNDTGSSIRLGSATINIYDAVGSKIGTRYANAKADALAPGQRTVLTETMPSLLYDQGELNHYPTGWASWELVLNATVAAPGPYDDVVIGSRLSSLAAGTYGGLTARGAAVNTLGGPIDWVVWWVVLYDTRGHLINVAWDLDAPNGLAPGAEVSFDVTIPSAEPICFATARAGAAGS
jgi:hypothetical protein